MSELDDRAHCAAVVGHRMSLNIPGTYPGGTFTERLLDAFGHADTENFERLAAAFPVLGQTILALQAEHIADPF